MNTSTNVEHTYFITITTYGERLHGDRRGSNDRRRGDLTVPRGPEAALARWEAVRMRSGAVRLSPRARARTLAAMVEVCRYRGWTLVVANVRASHLHIVVRASAPESKVLGDLKAWATRRLRETGLHGAASVWTGGGSITLILSHRQEAAVCDYVLHRQGANQPDAVFPFGSSAQGSGATEVDSGVAADAESDSGGGVAFTVSEKRPVIVSPSEATR